MIVAQAFAPQHAGRVH